MNQQTCSELLDNGTVQLLVLLYNSHVIQQPAGRNREEIIKEYMKKATLKKNISKALKDILKCKQENNPEMDHSERALKTTSSGTAWALTFFNHSLIFKFVNRFRELIHRQYERPSSCAAFSETCVKLLRNPDLCLVLEDDRCRNYFEQFGGFYVMVDLLGTHSIFHDHTKCSIYHCRRLMGLTIYILPVLLSSKHHPSKDFPSQLAASPFHTTMFVKLILENRKDLFILKPTAFILGVILHDTGIYDVRQAVRRFTEIMMNPRDDEKALEESFAMFNVLSHMLFKSDPACEEFYRIDGAVPFMVEEFVKHYSFVLDDSFSVKKAREDLKEDDEQTKLYRNKRQRVLDCLDVITQHHFPAHEQVQDLYRDSKVSTILVEIIKLVQSDDLEAHQYDWGRMFSSLSYDAELCRTISRVLKILYYTLKVSQSERTRVKEFVGLEFFRNLLTVPTVKSLDSLSLTADRLDRWIQPILEFLENE